MYLFVYFVENCNFNLKKTVSIHIFICSEVASSETCDREAILYQIIPPSQSIQCTIVFTPPVSGYIRLQCISCCCCLFCCCSSYYSGCFCYFYADAYVVLVLPFLCIYLSTLCFLNTAFDIKYKTIWIFHPPYLVVTVYFQCIFVYKLYLFFFLIFQK